MNSVRFARWILPAIIIVLGLADGALHFALDVVLFGGNFFGRLGPPPGAPQATVRPGPPVPLPLPLNQMFLLNCIGYLVLVGLFWFAWRRRDRWRLGVTLVLLAYVATAFLAWVDLGRPNPMGLGYLSKGVEIVLALALLANAWTLLRSTGTVRQTQPRASGARP
ncbi:MAG: hypothetical protein ACR2IK_22095 [Chloroflexota bacterium]